MTVTKEDIKPGIPWYIVPEDSLEDRKDRPWYALETRSWAIIVVLLLPIMFFLPFSFIPFLMSASSVLLLVSIGLLLGVQLALLFAYLNKLADSTYLFLVTLSCLGITSFIPVLAAVLPIGVPAFFLFLSLGTLLLVVQCAFFFYIIMKDAQPQAEALAKVGEVVPDKALVEPEKLQKQLSVSPAPTVAGGYVFGNVYAQAEIRQTKVLQGQIIQSEQNILNRIDDIRTQMNQNKKELLSAIESLGEPVSSNAFHVNETIYYQSLTSDHYSDSSPQANVSLTVESNL